MERQELINIVGYDPFNLKDNEFNKKNSYFLKLRFLYKIMLYTHLQVNFPRQWDADNGQYRWCEKRQADYLELTYKPEEIMKYRTGNCGIFSTLFEYFVNIVGFKVRHIGIIHSDRKQGHWCSEVLIKGKWAFFDTMYLNMPMATGIQEPYSGFEIMKNPHIYIDNIQDIFKGISIKTWLGLWGGLEIDKIQTYDIGKDKFFEKFYKLY